jgi:hypothetical protein
VDLGDDHLVMGLSQAIKCAKCFVIGIVNVSGEIYLRAFNAQETASLLEFNQNLWVTSMVGSIDCMY